MKKLLLLVSVVALCVQLTAQNLQTHYDFGKDRKYITTTMEMFRPDSKGNTFFFIDMDYYVGDTKGVSMAYWEIARVFTFKKLPVGLHVEFDGGFGRFATGNGDAGYRINESLLGGIDYSWNASDFSKGITVKALFKHIVDKHDASFQFTSVWYWHMFKKKLTFTGFADFWKEDSDFNFDGKADAEYIFLCEPQLWYNINKTFSVGGELELNNNFGGKEGFHANPTLGLKWNF